MIASQKIGKSFMGALVYNLKKLDHKDQQQRAELLDSNFISLDPKQIKAEVELIRQLRPNLSRYVYHTSLNFSKAEEVLLANEKLLAIAHAYLNGMGFTDNQYLIFRHYDADHPHIHLLVNRIKFDGDVVSDGNNYKRSEAILRAIEEQYHLTPVISSSQAKQRAANKDELEMVVRTGQPSQKMVLQELLKNILRQPNLTIPALIKAGEKAGIHFLFNQADNGRVSGITYFYEDFKIKGQALGKQFKWTELAKKINYEQIRDLAAGSEPFPYQLDQVIINGKYFFDMVRHYHQLSLPAGLLDVQAQSIMDALKTYPEQFRTGDKYVRMLFNCALLYYIDRFGPRELSGAVKKIFIWAYSLRLNYQVLQLASVDNYVLNDLNMFRKIRNAVRHENITAMELPLVNKEFKCSHTNDIKNLFIAMQYVNQ